MHYNTNFLIHFYSGIPGQNPALIHTLLLTNESFIDKLVMLDWNLGGLVD